MNITLAAPPDVIQNVRCWAEEQGTSLNQYIRDLLIAKDREIRLERKSRRVLFFCDGELYRDGAWIQV